MSLNNNTNDTSLNQPMGVADITYIDNATLLQVDATAIAGILIFLTLRQLSNDQSDQKAHWSKGWLVDPDATEISPQELVNQYFSSPEKAFKKQYPLDNEINEENQRLVRPIFNNVWMYGSLRSIL